ncbi:type II secretion system F family protein [Undibacterium sp. Xuan67W]|uniref:type II secretion system F family protein n=1 Tax=Undibacterium sp. Xuan67W TaxID=3413057 RepID=UPI003BEFF8A5
MPSHHFSPLSYSIRAGLFTHLAALEKAGLPAARAFTLIRLPSSAQARVEATRKLLVRGKDIATAGQQSGLFNDMEAQLLRAAISAGSPAIMYRRLAETYTEKDRLQKAVKARMRMPLLVLGLALLVQPLPALVAGTISKTSYLWSVVRPFLLLALGLAGYRFFLKWSDGNSGSALRHSVEKSLITLPVLGAMHVRRNARDFFESLGLMLEAGLPVFDALPQACNTISNQLIRADFSQVLPRLQQGMTLADALAACDYLGNNQATGLIQTGESSGTLSEMMLRHANSETAALSAFQQQLADWLPKIFYGAVMLWMAYSLITGHAFMPSVPKELAECNRQTCMPDDFATSAIVYFRVLLN